MIYNTSNKFPCLELRLFIVILISVFFIITDVKFNTFLLFRKNIENFVCVFHYLYGGPVYVYDYLSGILNDRRQLLLENDTLRKELFLKNSELLLLEQYRQENRNLYRLLNSFVDDNKLKLITKVIFTNIDLYNQYIVVNQGKNKNVYVGQPVISDIGIVGQIVSVNKVNSRVLLISDASHALSVRLKRNNNIRMILMGRGYVSELYAEYPNYTVDICDNDILVSSGLDGRFPEGYPVARVVNIKRNPDKDSTIIFARSIVNLEHLRYAILIW